MFRWVINPFGINEPNNLFTEEKEQPVMGAPRRAKQASARPWKLGLRTKFFQKT